MLAVRRIVRAQTWRAARHNATVASSPAPDAAASLPPPATTTKAPAAPAVASLSPKATTSPKDPEVKPVTSDPTTPGVDAQVEGSATAKTQGRKKYATRRPHITLERPKEWSRPIGRGVLPAYDEALRYIYEDSEILAAEARQLKQQVQEKEAALAGAEDTGLREELDALKKKVEIVEIQSQINRPEVRWKFRNGMADMSLPVYRKLADQKWRNEGDLDLLMERLHQMSVIPDILPTLHPNVDVRITFPEATTPRNIALRKRHKGVEPGVYLLPEQTRKPPHIYVTVMHPEERYYTLVLVDPDVPDERNGSYQTYLHWMITNVRLSSLSKSIPTAIPNIPVPYVPPHPQRGTPYHRYTLLLLPHADPSARISAPPLGDSGRAGFDLRAFTAKYGLDPSAGGGAHMWREVWDGEVSKIYRDTLKTDEPRVRPPTEGGPLC